MAQEAAPSRCIVLSLGAGDATTELLCENDVRGSHFTAALPTRRQQIVYNGLCCLALKTEKHHAGIFDELRGNYRFAFVGQYPRSGDVQRSTTIAISRFFANRLAFSFSASIIAMPFLV